MFQKLDTKLEDHPVFITILFVLFLYLEKLWLCVLIISNSYRKVVEHICLLKAKEDLSNEEENDMLDYLYTTQYQMAGILSVSLGELLIFPNHVLSV